MTRSERHVCVCRPERKRERWHIRPEGASLLECLASLPPPSTRPPSLPPPPSSNHRGGPKDKRGGPPRSCSSFRAGPPRLLLSNYAMIQCGVPSAKTFPHKFIARSIRGTEGEIIYIAGASQCDTPPRPPFAAPAECAEFPPRLNGNLVGINST